MNIFHAVVCKTLRQTRVRTGITITGIALACALITSIAIFCYSIVGYLYDVTLFMNGSWHCSLTADSADVVQQVQADERVAKCGISWSVGIAKPADNPSVKLARILVLEAGNKEYFETAVGTITKGRAPNKAGEILLTPECTDIVLLGDQITLNTRRILDIDTLLPPVTYEVVGFHSGNSPCMLYQEQPSSSESGERTLYLTMSDIRDTYHVSADLCKRYEGLHENTYNTWPLLFHGVTRADSSTLTYAICAALVFSLIMLGACALIYNAFSISVSERTRQFGLLSSVGGTKKQLRGSVYFEAFVVGGVGILLGIGIGILSMAVTIGCLSEKLTELTGWQLGLAQSGISFRLRVSPLVIVFAMVLSAVMVLLSVARPARRASQISAIEAMRMNKDIKAEKHTPKSARLVLRLFGVEGMLAQKYFRRSKRKYRVTIFSLCMSILLFISINSFVSYSKSLLTPSFRPDADIIAVIQNQPNPQSILEDFRAMPEMQRAEYFFSKRLKADDSVQSDAYNAFLMQDEIASSNEEWRFYVMSDDHLRRFLEEEGMNTAAYLDPAHPQVIVSDQCRLYDPEAEKYRTFSGLRADCDTIPISIGTDDPASGALPAAGIGAHMDHLPFGANQYIGRSIVIVASQSVADALIPSSKTVFTTPAFSFGTQDDLAATKQLDQYAHDNGLDMTLLNVAASNRYQRSSLLIMNVLSYGFIIIVSLICAANVFNTITTNFQLRRRDFAMLKSVGMTNGGLRKMMCLECVIYGAKSLLIGLPLSFLASYGFFRSTEMSCEMPFYIPISGFLIATLSVFAVVFTSALYALHKLRNINPIDVLKQENI